MDAALADAQAALDVDALEAAFATGLPLMVHGVIDEALDAHAAALETARLTAAAGGLPGAVQSALAAGAGSAPVCAPREFTDKELVDGLQDYTAGGELNNGLRHGWQFSIADARTVRQMDELMAQRALHMRVDLWRVTPSDVLKDLKVGSEFVDHGFVSTTKSRAALDRILEDVLGDDDWTSAKIFRIRTPQGTRAVDVNSTLGPHYFADQKEIVLDRSLRYRVTGLSKADDGTPIVEVEVVGRADRRAQVVVKGAAAREPDANAVRFVWRDGDVVVEQL